MNPETMLLVTNKRLSISPQELLTTGAATLLLGMNGIIPDKRRVVLRCDNISSCSVGNTEAACSPAI